MTARRILDLSKLTEDVLRDLYITKWLSTTVIASMYGCSRDTILNRIKSFGLPLHYSRTQGLTRNVLIDMYITQQWSTIKIAKHFGLNDEAIRGRLIRYSIPRRTKSEAGKIKEWTPEHLAKLKEGARKVNFGKIGPLNHNWKGGRHINSYGYVVLRVNKEDVLEHRHVMQEQLGRTLEPWEEVNHINGIKTDNRPENLEVIYSEHRHKDWLRRHASIDK